MEIRTSTEEENKIPIRDMGEAGTASLPILVLACDQLGAIEQSDINLVLHEEQLYADTNKTRSVTILRGAFAASGKNNLQKQKRYMKCIQREPRHDTK